MKSAHPFLLRNSVLTTALIFPVISFPLSAASVVWLNSATDFNAGSSWVGSTTPGSGDFAVFTGAKVTDPTLSAPASVRGLVFSNATAASYAIGGATLTLGSGGIDASAVTSGTNSLTAGLALAAGGQTWTVGTGSSLAVSPSSLTRSRGAVVHLDTTLGTGTVSTSTLTNTNAILGPWATIRSSGASANASASGDTYATISSGSLVPYTGATASTGTGALGGSIPSGGTSTLNYDLSGNGTLGSFGLARNIHTIRYTGTGARQPGNTAGADLLSLNGFMNAGTGVFTFGTLGNVANDRPYNVLAGPSLELVLDARSADIVMLSPVKNNAGGASALTTTGNNTVTLSAVNPYTGATTVAGGTLLVNGTGSINASSGVTINGSNARFLHTSSVASTVPVSLVHGTLDSTGTLGAVTVADSSAAVLTHGNGTGSPLTTSSLSFQGDATVNLNFVGSTPIVVSGALSTTPANGQVTLNVPAALPNGLTNLISFGSFSGSAADFTGNFTTLGPRQVAGPLVVNGNNIAANISGETVVWTGASGEVWDTAATGDESAPNNWSRKTAQNATNFWASDTVEFNDTYNIGAGSVPVTQAYVKIDSSVSPASTTLNNSSVAYVIDSFGSGISTGSVVKSGTATTTFVGEHSYPGPTTINSGTVRLGDGTFNGSLVNTLSITNNASLVIDSSSGQTAARPISGTGTLTKIGTGTLTLSGNNTYSGGTTLSDGAITLINDGSLGTGTINLAATTTLNINKNLALTNTVTGSGAIINTGSTTITGDLSGFTGSYTHNTTFVSTALNNGNATSQNASYQIATAQGSSQGMIAGGNGDYTLRMGSLSGIANSLFRGGNVATGTTILEIGNLNTNTDFAGIIANGATKVIGLTKVGTGTLTLSGACNYSAPTLVNAGTLQVNGSLAAASAVTVGSGATLKGSGTVAGTINSSGIIAPGATTGILTTGAVTLTGTLAVEIDGTSADKLVSTGDINLTGSTLTLDLLTGGFTEASYVIAEGTSITGTFATIPSGYSVNIISGGPGQQAVLTSSTGGYSTWAAANVAGEGANLDTDKDGVPNGVEYFLNAPAGFTASPAITAGSITWTNGGNIPASGYGTEFFVQTSPDLINWTPVTAGNLTANTSGPGGSLTYTLPTGAGKIFVRLVVNPN